MKKTVYLFVVLILISFSANAQDTTIRTFRSVTNNAFKQGEKLEFEINYGFINAGLATLEIDANTSNINGRECYLAKVYVNSSPSFDFIYKFNEQYKTFLDKEGIFPWLTEQDKTEGKDYRYSKTEFDQENQKVIITEKNASGEEKKKEVKIDLYTLDDISAFYYTRTMDISGKQPGEVIMLPYLAKDELKEMKIKILGRENVEVPAGEFRCVMVQPMLKESALASKVDDITVWLTDDENKIPVKVQMKIIIGSVKVELRSIQGVDNIRAKVN